MARKMWVLGSAVALSFLGGCTVSPTPEPEALGQASEALDVARWSPDQRQVPKSNDAPALATFAGKVHQVATADSSNLLAHSTFDGTSWSTAVLIPNQRSKAQPALAAHRIGKGPEKLHMVHQGDTADTLWWSTFDGTSWSPNIALPFESAYPPALASYGGKLFLAFGICGYFDDCMIRYSTYDGATWSTPTSVRPTIPVIGPEISAFGRGHAFAVHGGKLYFAYRSVEDGNALYFMTYDGINWTHRVRIPGQQSKSAPALASFDGDLHLLHLGDSSNKIWYSTFDGTNFVTNLAIPNSYSRFVPAMASTPTFLLRAHVGDTSNALYYSTYR